MKISLLIIVLFTKFSYSQSNFEKILRSGEVIVNGLTFFKKDKSDSNSSNSKLIESICVKNKLQDKVTINFTGRDENDNLVKKELVIQKDGKECVFELPKGIYTYEIVLPNKEVYKKGEYKFDDEMVITVN
ncbi:hypothetical protein [Flavobacterium sp.]|uniref:hypothetical protein n=1 Tax=Flavobacterium sp. TaxID=239 RepID=UPI0039197F32